jgi:GT2 family glycosyltransferase
VTREEPAVAVVVITRDRRDAALHAVTRLSSLPDAGPVIVVDNGSTDGTVAALSSLTGVTVIAEPENLGAAGRNVGVQHASTPYVAFADDDSGWAPGALATAAQLLDEHPRLGGLVARTIVGDAQTDDPLNDLLAAAPLGQEPDLPGPTALGFLACALIVRRPAFLDVGGFHRRYELGGEERLLALDLLDAGWPLAYAPQVIAHHHPETGGERPGRRARMIRNDLWTYWLRRHRRAAIRFTLGTARTAVGDAAARRGLLQALPGLPWVLRERRALSPSVEELAGRLDPG